MKTQTMTKMTDKAETNTTPIKNTQRVSRGAVAAVCCLVISLGALWGFWIADNTLQPARTPTRPISWDDETHRKISGAGIYDIHKNVQTFLNPFLQKRVRGGTPTLTGDDVRQLNDTELGFAVPWWDPLSKTTHVSNVTAKFVLRTDAEVEAAGGVVPVAADPDADQENPQEVAFAYNFKAYAGVPGVGSTLVSSGLLSCTSQAEEVAAPEVQEPTNTTTTIAASCQVEKGEVESGRQGLVQSGGPPRRLWWKLALKIVCTWVKYCDYDCTGWVCKVLGECRSICIQVVIWVWEWVSSCFAPDALVTTLGGKQVPISEIDVGDSVLTPQGFEPVYFLTHADDNTPTPYVEFRLSTGGTPIYLSPGHYLPVDGKYRLAQNVRPGMRVQLGGGGEAIVDRIRMVVKRGAFNPLVMSGEIIVDDVVASDKSDFLVEGLIREAWAPVFYQNLFAPLRGIYWLMGPDLVRRFCQEYRNTGALSHLSVYDIIATLTKLLLSAEEDVEQPGHQAEECGLFNPLAVPGKIIVDRVAMSYP